MGHICKNAYQPAVSETILNTKHWALSVSTLIVLIYNLLEMDSSISLKISGSFIISCLCIMAKIRPL